MIAPSTINELLGVNDSYKAPEAMMKILYDKPVREKLMRQLLVESNYNVDEDFFREYFENEHADRKVKKQDFTPPSLAKLVSHLVGSTTGAGTHYEPCTGTGSMTITQWNYDRMQHSPFDYRPSWYFYTCEELSDRALPFLLFNLALRGMNAVVVQCDVLSRKAYGAFFIQNDSDDHLKFSSINRLPYSKEMEKYLAVEFVEERYPPLVESPKDFWNLSAFANPVEKGHVSDFTKAFYALCGVSDFKFEKKEIEPVQLTLF